MSKLDGYPLPTLHRLPLRERPVYRVSQDANGCNLVELLAALIGGPRQIEVAQTLLAEFRNLAGMAQASAAQIQTAVHGLGAAKAARLKAALTLSRRLLTDDDPKPKISNPTDAVQLLQPEMAHLEQEHLRVLLLNTKNRVIDSPTIYVGSANSILVRSAEVLRLADVGAPDRTPAQDQPILWQLVLGDVCAAGQGTQPGAADDAANLGDALLCPSARRDDVSALAQGRDGWLEAGGLALCAGLWAAGG